MCSSNQPGTEDPATGDPATGEAETVEGRTRAARNRVGLPTVVSDRSEITVLSVTERERGRERERVSIYTIT